MTNVRWTVVALIFFATTINYIDRQVIGLLKPYIQEDLGWTEADYGYIVTAFQIAYGIGMLLGGRMLDRFGSKLGYSIAIVVWSIGAVLHASETVPMPPDSSTQEPRLEPLLPPSS